VQNVSLDTVDVRNNQVGLNVTAVGSATVSEFSTDTVGLESTTDAGIFRAMSGATVENLAFELTGFNESGGTGLSILADGGDVQNVSLDTVDVRNNDDGLAVIASGTGSVTNVSTDTVAFESDEDAAVFEANGDATVRDLTFELTGFNESGGTGLQLLANDNATLANVVLDTADVRNNADGLRVIANDTATIGNISTDTIAFASDDDAATFEAHDDAVIADLGFELTGFNESGGTGLVLLADGGVVRNVTLDTVLASGNTVGINATADDSGVIRNVSADTVLFSDNTDGLRIGAVDDASIEDVRIALSGLNKTTNALVFDGDGGSYSDVRIKESLIRDNDVGVLITPTTSTDGLRVIRSLIANNTLGIDNQNGTGVFDARNNWWGDSGGPSSATNESLADPVNGKLAIGNGSSVSEGATPGVSNVRFDPAIGGKNRNEEDDQIIDPVTFVEGSNGVPANFSVEFAGVTIEGPVSDFTGVNVWERSVFPFRADEDDAANKVPNAQVFIRTSSGDTSINRDFLKVYQKGEPLNITFREVTGANTTRFAGKEVQFHAFRANDTDSLSGAFSQDINETTGNVSIGSSDVQIVELRDSLQFDGDGELSLEFTPDRPGEFLFALSTVESGDGFQLNDTGTGRLSANILNDSTVFAGFETITVQETSSNVTPARDPVVAGEELTFDAESNLASGEVDHALILYDKAAFESKQVFVNDTSLDTSGDNVLVNVTGIADGNAFVVTVNATESGEVNEISASGAFEDVPLNATVLLQADSTEELTATVPLGSTFDDGAKTFQWIHTAAVTGNATSRSTDVGTVTVNEPPEIELNRTGIGFGDVAIGSSRTAGLNVTNIGAAQLNISSVDIVGVIGSDASQFTVADAGSSTLAPGESTIIRVRFTPSSPGVQNARLEIASNAGADPTTVVELSGTGDIIPDVDPDTLTFGSVDVGSTRTETVNVSNPGTDPVSINGVSIGSGASSQFSANGSSLPTTLAPGENITIEVTFAPTGSGQKTARLDIETDAAADPSVFLTGTGVLTGQESQVTIVEASAERVRAQLRNLRAGQDLNVSSAGLGDADVRFDGVNIRFKNSISTTGQAGVDLARSVGAPNGSPPLTGAGDVARYLNVTATGLDDDIDNVRFRFRVSETRLGDRDPENVVLYRFSDGAWGPLDTTFLRTTENDWNRFVAESPGFSAFAVVIQEPDLAITDTSLDPENVFVGEDTTATATIENTGTGVGEFTAQLTANGDPIATQTVTVPGGESRTVEFTVSFDETGTFDLAINGTAVGTVTVSEAPDISVDPASVDFGSAGIGTTTTESVTVTNNGDFQLDLTSVRIAGIDRDAFTITSGGGTSSIAPGESTTIEVAFVPSSVGAKSARLAISSNDPDSPTTTVALSGTADSAPDIARSPGRLEFGTVTTAESVDRRLIVANFGTEPLEITSTSVTGADAGEFTVVDAGSSTVAPGNQTEVRVRFAPGTAGAKSAQLEIESNDPDEGTLTVPLVGTGVVAAVPELSVSPTDIDFGTVAVGDTVTEDATVTNTGDANLTITAVTVTGPDAGAFDAPSVADPITLAPGESVTEAITFAPTSSGDKSATITIESNDPEQPLTNVSVSGTAAETLPVIEVDPSSVEFGEVTVGEAATDSVAVTNTGDAPLELTSVSVTGSDASAFAVTDSGDGPVASGETTTIQLEFAPDSEGDKTAQLEIESNDPNAGTVTVDLSGSGAAVQTPTPTPTTPTPTPTTTTSPPPTTTTPTDDGPPVALIVIVVILIIVGILAALYFRGGPGFGDTGGG
jgi:hypothetical protein